MKTIRIACLIKQFNEYLDSEMRDKNNFALDLYFLQFIFIYIY